MTNKIKNQVLENPTKIREVNRLHSRLLSELESFRSRNALPTVMNECCPRCLKAHLIKKAPHLGLQEEKNKINQLLDCEIGHSGYYLDKNKLVKI